MEGAGNLRRGERIDRMMDNKREQEPRGWVVAWISRVTPAKGQGTGVFSYKDAKQIADDLNAANAWPLHHYAKAVYDD